MYDQKHANNTSSLGGKKSSRTAVFTKSGNTRSELKKKIRDLNLEIYALYQTYTDICDPECVKRVKEIDKERKQIKKILREKKEN